MTAKSTLEVFNAEKGKLKTFDAFRKFLFKHMESWSLSITWANGEPFLKIAVTGFINPPRRYNLRGTMVMADNEDEWVQNAVLVLPRIIQECQEIDNIKAREHLSAFVDDAARQMENITRQRRVSAAAQAVASNGDTPLSAPARRNNVVKRNRATPKRGQQHRKRG